MRTENVEFFRGPNPPGPKATPVPQPMRPGSDAVRGGASGEARDTRERFQLPDEATRNGRDNVRRDDAGRPAEAGGHSGKRGLGRDFAPGQLVMREVLERLGVDGPFKVKAASGGTGTSGAFPGQVNSLDGEGQASAETEVSAEQLSTERALDGQDAVAELSLDAASPDTDGMSAPEDFGEAVPAAPQGNAGEEADPANENPAKDTSTSETSEDHAGHVDTASLSSAVSASDSGNAEGGADAAEIVPSDVLTEAASDGQDADAGNPELQDSEAAAEPAPAIPTPVAGEAADAAAIAGPSSLAGSNAGAIEAGRGRRAEGGSARNGVAHRIEGVAPDGPPGIMKRDGLAAQASPVAAANVPFAPAVPADATAADELAQDAPGQAASPDDAVGTNIQPKPAQALDNPGLRRALGQLGMTPGQGGAIPVSAQVGAGEPGVTGPGAQQGPPQLPLSPAEAAGRVAPTVPPAPVVPNVPLGAVPIEIGLKAMAGVNHFQIRLDPAELGRIDVNLEIDTDGTIKARLTVDRVETLTLLQRDARTLERAFEQAGLKPSDSGVDLSLRDQGREDRRGPPENGGRDNAPAHAKAGGESEAKRAETTVAQRTIWRGTAGIDVRV